MTFTFTKEPGNLVPFPRKTAGKLEDLPQSLQPTLLAMTQHPEAYPTPGQTHSADADNYALEVEDQGKTWSFRFRDLEIPAGVMPLIDHLRQQVR
jgi:hypothetical protein